MEMKTQQETLEEIARVAEAKGDSFQVKIIRRNSLGDTQPEVWCILAEAQALQIANKEVWLVPLTGQGGGVFDLLAFHSSEPMKPIGSVQRIVKNDNKRLPPAVELIGKDTWQGPRALVYPERKALQAVESIGSGNGVVNGNGMPATAFLTGMQVVPTAASAKQMQGVLSVTDEIEKKRLMQTLDEIARREAALAELEKKAELRSMVQPLEASLQRMQQAVESANTRAEQAAKDAERRLSDMATSHANKESAAPKKSMIEELTPLLTLLVPMYTEMKSRDEKRQQDFIMMLKESSEKAAERTEKIIEKLSEKKDDKNLLDLTASVGQTFSTMSNMIVQMAHNVRDLQQPAEEPSAFVTVMEGISKPLDKIASAYLLDKQRTNGAIPAKALPAASNGNGAPAPATSNDAAATPQEESSEAPSMPNIEAIGKMILLQKAAPDVIVNYFFDHFREADFQSVLTEKDVAGDPERMLDFTLQEWIKDGHVDVGYLNSIKLEFRKQATTRGFANDSPKPAPAPAPVTQQANSNVVPIANGKPAGAIQMPAPTPEKATTEGEDADDDLTDDEAGDADDDSDTAPET